MPKSIEFPKAAPQWSSGRFSVQFFALVDKRVVQCLVSLEALWDHFGVREPNPDEAVRAFLDHRESIEQAARRKIEAAAGGNVSEVVLRPEDFPHRSSNGTPRVKPLTVRESPAIRNDPALLSKVDQISSLLQENYVRMDTRVTAEWDLIPTSGEPLIQLVLKDDETEAAVNTLFTRADLAGLPKDWFALFQIWMNMRDARSDRLRQALEVSVGAED